MNNITGQPVQEVAVAPAQKSFFFSLVSAFGTVAMLLWVPYTLFICLGIGLISSGAGTAAKIYSEYGSYLFFFNITMFGLSFLAYKNKKRNSLLSIVPLLLLLGSFYASQQFDHIDDKMNNRAHLQRATTATETRFVCKGAHQNAYITTDRGDALVSFSVGNAARIGMVQGKDLYIDSGLPKETIDTLISQCFNSQNQILSQVYNIR